MLHSEVLVALQSKKIQPKMFPIPAAEATNVHEVTQQTLPNFFSNCLCLTFVRTGSSNFLKVFATLE